MIPDFIYFAGKQLEKDIGPVYHDMIKPFFSEGKWSMHELMLYLLGITGPAKVYLSTFSISEVAIRSFASAIDQGLISELHCLFDHNIRRHKLELMYFASNIVSDITLSANHSKLILIENLSWKITVVGSANMTPNPRKEAGVIFSVRETYDDFLKHLVKAISDGLPVNFKNN